MKSNRRLLLFLVSVFLVPSFFVNYTAGWNVESRWALAAAIARDGVTYIEDYVTHSRDVTEIDGHLYSAKAPGLSLLCVPILWSLDRLYPEYTFRAETAKRYVCRIVLIGFSLVGMGYLIWNISSAFSPLVAACTVVGSPLLPYSSVLYGHVAAAFLLFAAWRFLNSNRGNALGAGLLCGMAVLVEYPAIFGVVVMAGFSLRRSPRDLTRFIFGGIPAGIVLMAYNYWSFGTVFATGYTSFSDPEFQAVVDTGFFGFGLPSIRTAISMLFGPYRGLFVTAPWLILWFTALPVICAHRSGHIVSAIIPVIFIIILSGFTMWWGGASCCMRHLLIVIPFMASLVVYLSRKWLIPLITLGMISTMCQMSFLLVEPETPEDYAIPLVDQAIPWLLGSRMRPLVLDSMGILSSIGSGVVLIVVVVVWYCAIADYRQRRVVSGGAP